MPLKGYLNAHLHQWFSGSGVLLSASTWLQVDTFNNFLDALIKVLTLTTLVVGLSLTIRKHLKEQKHVKIYSNPSNYPAPNDAARILHKSTADVTNSK